MEEEENNGESIKGSLFCNGESDCFHGSFQLKDTGGITFAKKAKLPMYVPSDMISVGIVLKANG
jgi:hypothetical protein